MIRYVFFDLDGTLLPMDQDVFIDAYFKRLAAKLMPHGFAPKQLIGAVWKGTMAMIQNDGSATNEEVFWKVFTDIFGQESKRYEPVFEAFYHTDFQEVQSVCGFTPKAREVIDLVKSKSMTPVLATNPIFPAIATMSRIRWAGMDARDFALVTTYENSRYSKPNPEYYRDILAQLGASPEQCVMVGNDVSDDMVAAQVGMPVFLLTDCLINKGEVDISQYPNGDFDALIAFIHQLNQ